MIYATRILLLITGLLAAYQVVVGIEVGDRAAAPQRRHR